MPSDPASPAGSSSEGFPTRERVCLRRDYDRAYRSGVRSGSRSLVLHVAPNGLDHPRLGLTVSRKVGGAVVRNRVRRRLRDIYRRNRACFPAGYDVVVGARPASAQVSYAELQRDLLQALGRLHLSDGS